MKNKRHQGFFHESSFKIESRLIFLVILALVMIGSLWMVGAVVIEDGVGSSRADKLDVYSEQMFTDSSTGEIFIRGFTEDKEHSTNLVSTQNPTNFNGYVIEFDDEPLLAKKANLEKKAEEDQKYIENHPFLSTITLRRLRVISPSEIPGKIQKYSKDLDDSRKVIKSRVMQVKPNAREIGEFKKTFNGVVLDVNPREAQEIEDVRGVKSVSPNYEVDALLQDSVPLIQNGISAGQLDRNGEDCSLKPLACFGTNTVSCFTIGQQRGQDGCGRALDYCSWDGKSCNDAPGIPFDCHAWDDDQSVCEELPDCNLGNSCLTGEGVSIAIIDTGVDYNHPDLASNYMGGYDFVNNDEDPMDDHGHGTHVAATAAGNGVLKGVAPDAKIYAYKVLSASGSGWASDIIKAIEKSVDLDENGIPCESEQDYVDAISLSLGGTGNPNDPLSKAIDNSAECTVPVVAAGNSGPEGQTINSPGTARKAVTVGASNKYDGIPSFSSRGPVFWVDVGGNSVGFVKPDILAPGVNICAAQWDSAWAYAQCLDNKHVAISGTSMATPHVSGAVALIKQAHPDWTPEEIKAALKNTANNLGIDQNIQGSGRINVPRAISLKTKPLQAEINLGIEGDEIVISMDISGDGVTGYDLSYKRLDGKYEWTSLISFDDSTDDIEEIRIDLTTLDGGYVIFRLTANSFDQIAKDEKMIYVDNFGILGVGKNNYVLASSEDNEIFVDVKRGKWKNYDVYYGKFLGHELYGEWTLLSSYDDVLSSGVVGQIDTNKLESGKYRLKIVARDEHGNQRESDVFEGVIILKEFGQTGELIFTTQENPKLLSVEKFDGELKTTVQTFENIQLGGGWYMPQGVIEIWNDDGSLFRTIRGLYREGEYYPYGNNGHRDYVIYVNQDNPYLVAQTSAIEANGGQDGWFRQGVFDMDSEYQDNWPYYQGHNLGPEFNLELPIVSDDKIIFLNMYRDWDVLQNDASAFLKSFELHIRIFSDTGSLEKELKYKPLGGHTGELDGASLDYAPFVFKESGINYLGFFELKRVCLVDAGCEKKLKSSIIVFNLDTGELVLNKLVNPPSIDDSLYLLHPTVIDNKIVSTAITLSADGRTSKARFYIFNLRGEVEISKELCKEGVSCEPYSPEIIPLDYNKETYFVVGIADEYGFSVYVLNSEGDLVREIGSLPHNLGYDRIIRTGDVDNDGIPEIVVPARPRQFNGESSYLKIYDFFGEEEESFIIPTQGEFSEINDIAIVDRNNDGKTDLLVAVNPYGIESLGGGWGRVISDKGLVYVFDLEKEYNSKLMFWPLYKHDSQRTGCYDCDKKSIPPEPPTPTRTPSRIINNMDTGFTGAMEIYVQKNTTGVWGNYAEKGGSFVNPVFTQGGTIPPDYPVDLKEFFNPNNIAINQPGNYRVYAVVKDAQGREVKSASYEFSVSDTLRR